MKEEYKYYKYGLYISDKGNVRKENRNKVKFDTQTGRKVVSVKQPNGKRTKVLIGKAVCELFKPEEKGRYLHHKDNDLRNCSKENVYLSNTNFKEQTTRYNSPLTLGEKLNLFDNSNETVKDFNDIFGFNLEYKEDDTLLIGSLVTDSIRNIFVNDDLLILDLEKK